MLESAPITESWVRTDELKMMKRTRSNARKRRYSSCYYRSDQRPQLSTLSPFVVFTPSHRTLQLRTVKRARKASQAYTRTYGQDEPVSQLVKSTAGVMQEYTQRGGVRPFGVSLLIAGLDTSPHATGKEQVPALYQVDPSGAYFAWKATAIGKNYVSAKNILEKRWTSDMELEDAIHTALLTLREGFEGEMTANNIEVGIVRKGGKFEVLTPSQIQDYLDEAN